MKFQVSQETWDIILLCPECMTPLRTRYDYLKMETSCKHCGLLLQAPPEYGIVYPEVIRRVIRIK